MVLARSCFDPRIEIKIKIVLIATTPAVMRAIGHWDVCAVKGHRTQIPGGPSFIRLLRPVAVVTETLSINRPAGRKSIRTWRQHATQASVRSKWALAWDYTSSGWTTLFLQDVWMFTGPTAQFAKKVKQIVFKYFLNNRDSTQSILVLALAVSPNHTVHQHTPLFTAWPHCTDAITNSSCDEAIFKTYAVMPRHCWMLDSGWSILVPRIFFKIAGHLCLLTFLDQSSCEINMNDSGGIRNTICSKAQTRIF